MADTNKRIAETDYLPAAAQLRALAQQLHGEDGVGVMLGEAVRWLREMGMPTSAILEMCAVSVAALVLLDPPATAAQKKGMH